MVRERFRGHRDDHRMRLRSRRSFFWMCAIDKPSGRPIIDGPHSDSTSAEQFGFEKIKDGDFKVYEFNTRDKTAARDMFKHIMLEESGQVADVLKRARYKI